VVHFAKALAYFRGQRAVGLDDLRQIVPWALLDKLKQNPQSAFFQRTDNKVYLTDRVSWIGQLFDRSIQQHASYEPIRTPLLRLEEQAVDAGRLASLEIESRLRQIRAVMEDLLKHNELNGPVYEDLVRLKHIHNRYLHGARSRPGAFE
jgi:hypothetical protein